MRGLRITLDKSAVFGLNNEEVDSLDRYFFQVVPPILVNEIRADLTKEADTKIPNKIAAHTYRVSGNHGLTINYRTRLANSLLGRENPKANFLWHLSLTNPQLFKTDRKMNDRKDLQYCYYLPNTQIFATRDDKQLRLMAALMRPDQSLVNGDELKRDLRKISEDWNGLTSEEKIALNARRGDAPPENPDSLVYQLWKKHDGKINPSKFPEMSGRKLVDASLPKEHQDPFTFSEFLQKKAEEIREGKKLSVRELEALNQVYFDEGRDPFTMLMFNSRIDRERLRKWHPELTEADVDELTAEERNEIYLDPYEYRNILIID